MSSGVARALVTGGSKGLGAAVAGRLAERGYRVTVVARNEEQLRAVVAALPGEGHQFMVLDLATSAGANALVERIESESWDVLVNNAGSTRFGPLKSLGDSELDGILRLNLVTPARASGAFARGARAGAVLVNVTSIVGVVPVPGNSPYSASKAGLQALTECLWYELHESGVRVLDFRPVSIRTDFHESAGQKRMATGLMVDPAVAAAALVRSIEGRDDFVQGHGLASMVMELARRMLPRRSLIRLMGRRGRRAGYLEGP